MAHPKFEHIDIKSGTMTVEIPHVLRAADQMLIRDRRIVHTETDKARDIDVDLRNKNPIVRRTALVEALKFLRMLKNSSGRVIAESDLSARGILQQATDNLAGDFKRYLHENKDAEIEAGLKEIERAIKPALLNF